MKTDYLDMEDRFLSEFAVKSKDTKGRQKEIEPCPIRTEFQRDRDRILHCKSFRRLKHKTQVFLSPNGDHYRTRLTHTLEVNQIARTVSRALQLNEDLTEAIALGHDLGHTPFGHKGENTLHAKTGNFEHNAQSLRIVDVLENDGQGLNLTWEVRDGILNHRSSGNPATLEGAVVCLADKIAYLNHDIDDAIRAGILTYHDLPKDIINLLGSRKGEMINTLVADIIDASYKQPKVLQTSEYKHAMADLRKFMFQNVYTNSKAKDEEIKADRLIRLLFDYFMDNPQEVPVQHRRITDDKTVFITDYIAGMSDNFAEKVFKDIFMPKAWEA